MIIKTAASERTYVLVKRLVEIINGIKNDIQTLLNKDCTTAGTVEEYPQVDFIVDTFDRPTGMLGSVWDSSSATIYYDGWASGTAFYKHPLSSDEFHIKVLTDGNNPYFALYSHMSYRPSGAAYLAQSYTGGIGYSHTYTGGSEHLKVVVGAKQNGELPTDTAQRVEGWVTLVSSFPSGSLTAGEKTLSYLNATGINYGGTVGVPIGQVIGGTNIAYLANSAETNIVGFSAYYSTSSLYRGYINYFKAWVAGIPEPPDVTGHGRYVDGQFIYDYGG